jgi:SAM-dependent methyltransferase
MRCAPGTHEAAMELLLRHAVARSGVLDLASGSGAFVARLRDQGFADLHAVELDEKKFQCDGIKPRAVDLNGEFAAQFDRKFTLVSAIEIVEHLDSPRRFLRQIRQLLTDDGHLLISTPNFADVIGRMKFLLTGELRYFDEGQYRYNHHISPITDTQMRLMLHEVGFDLVESVTAGDFGGGARGLLLKMARRIAAVMMRGVRNGEVHIYLAKRASQERNVKPTDWTK